MSAGYPFCDSDCPSTVTSPRHVFRPSMSAFSYAPDNVCHTTLFPNPVCTHSILEGDSYHDSLHLPVSCDQFLKLGVAKRLGLTAICHYWEYTFVKCFPLPSHWHIFVSHDVVQLTECIPSLSDSPFHFLYLVVVLSHHLPKIYITVDLLDLLSIDMYFLDQIPSLISLLSSYHTTLYFLDQILSLTSLFFLLPINMKHFFLLAILS